MGSSLAVYAYLLATEDIKDRDGRVYRKITGAGPTDYQIRKQWEANGWQPYSIAQKNKDGTITYKQYNRMDPRFFGFGIVADYIENKDNIQDKDMEDAIFIAVANAAKNSVNKAYMRGVADVFDVIESDNPDAFSRYFGRQIGNAIPYQAFIGQGIPGIIEADKESYEARSFADEFLRKVPLLSKDKFLQKRRDILTGEPIEKNPTSFYANPEGAISYLGLTAGPLMVGRRSDVKEDKVRFEIMRLKRRLPEPNRKLEKVVKLDEYEINGQSAHNYWVERIGKTEINGITLYETLEQTIEGSDYQFRQEGNENDRGGKEIIIDSIYNAFKRQAKQDMLEKYTEVNEAVENAREIKFGLREEKFDLDEESAKELLPRK